MLRFHVHVRFSQPAFRFDRGHIWPSPPESRLSPPFHCLFQLETKPDQDVPRNIADHLGVLGYPTDTNGFKNPSIDGQDIIDDVPCARYPRVAVRISGRLADFSIVQTVAASIYLPLPCPAFETQTDSFPPGMV